MTRRLLLILASISILSGCGYALRGNVTLPDSLGRMVVIGNDFNLVDKLEDTLSNSGVTLSDSEDKSATVIDLGETEYEREVRTTDANGLVTAYTLRYDVGYDVKSGSGEELQINQNLSQTRVLNYDPLQELQSEEEEAFLREEMVQEIVLQILRRLSRI